MAAASVIPAAVAVAVLSSFPSCHPLKSLQPIPLCLHSHITTTGSQHTSETKSLNPLFSALHMEIPSSGRQPSERKDEMQELRPEVLTEFMVDMKCDGCVSDVKSKLQTIEDEFYRCPPSGVKRVDVDLTNQIVRVLGSISLQL